MDRSDPAYRGQRDYTWPVLRAYDPLVLGPIARFVWRCPTSLLVERYRRHITGRHLDVGPGTGYFLERSCLPQGSEVTILDPNTNVLRHVARRLRHLDVATVEADVLKPLPVRGPYDSAALHLVMHCLPGPQPRKARAIENVAAVLTPEGVLFGASVIGARGKHSRAARLLLEAFNRQGGFDNRDDTEEGLREILLASFEDVAVEAAGSIAVFRATRPRATGTVGPRG
jgi:SAM-dependent methyltransferase